MLPGSRAQAEGSSDVLEIAAGTVKEKQVKKGDQLEYLE